MILFINGPFGMGKTSVARVLVQKMPHSMLDDPEVVGVVLHRILGPFGKAEDFQDYALWRPLVVGGVRLLRKVSPRTLVIPMTVWRRDLFDPSSPDFAASMRICRIFGLPPLGMS